MTNTRAVNEVRNLQCMQPWGDEQHELAMRHARELDTLREVWEAVFDPDQQRINKDMRGLRNTILVLESQLATSRNEALEDAAKLAEDSAQQVIDRWLDCAEMTDYAAARAVERIGLAKQIRALKCIPLGD